MFGLMGVARNGGQPGAGFTYYVDSVSGSDANSGTSPALAKQTIAAVPTLTAGQSIGLARGSTWREELVISADNCLVGAYGTGERPMLDCSDVVAAGDWTKTGGRTNVYEATIAVGYDALASEWPGLWVDDVRMPVVDSLALCDSTPGSIYHGSVTDTSPITLYVHPPGSTDATSDGKVYEASVRRSGVYSHAAANVTIRGLQGRRNYASYGSFCVGRGGLLDDCLALDGNTHSIFLRGNAEARDCIARDCYNHTTAPTMYIGFELYPTDGDTITYTRCTAENTAYYADCIGFYCHTAGDDNFASVSHAGCVVDNVGSPFSIANATICYVTGGTVTNFFNVLGSTDTPIIANGLNVSAAKSGATWGNFSGAAAAITLDGCDAVFNSTGSFTALTSGQVFTMRNCTITGAGQPVRTYVGGVTFVIENNVFVPTMYTIFGFYSTAPTITSDYNDFGGSTGEFVIGGVTYANLAAWQAGTGQDMHSTP